MKTKIALEVAAFLTRHSLPAAQLAKEAGVLPVTLTRVLAGTRRDMTSTTADKLREAMKRLEEVRRAG